jgi:hypothetical protein
VRDRFVAPGLAAAAFAATLRIIAWQRHLPTEPPQVVLNVPASAQTRTLAASAAPVAAAAAASSIEDSPQPPPAVESDDADTGLQPQLPDSAALPSYEEDQAAVDADAMRNARSR